VFVALGIQHAVRMGHIVISLSGLTIFFPHFLTKVIIFEKNIEYKMCTFIFFTSLSETFLTLRITERDVIKTYIGLHVK